MSAESTLNERVAEEIRVMLARRNITATELARRAGMTQRSISRRITGEKVIDVDDLEKIAAALGVEVATLLPVSRKVDRIAYPAVPARSAPRSKRLMLASPHSPTASDLPPATPAGVRRPTIRCAANGGVTA